MTRVHMILLDRYDCDFNGMLSQAVRMEDFVEYVPLYKIGREIFGPLAQWSEPEE